MADSNFRTTSSFSTSSSSAQPRYPNNTMLETDSSLDDRHAVYSICDSGFGESSTSFLSGNVSGVAPVAPSAVISGCSTVGSQDGTDGGSVLVDQFDRLAVTVPETNATLIREVPVTSPQQQYSEYFTQDEDGDTQLHLAIIQPNVEVALYFIRCAQIPDYFNIQNNQYWHTPLHLAVITDQPRIVRALVINGASITIRDHQGNTPLHLACARGLLTCLQQLTALPTAEERDFIFETNANRNRVSGGAMQQALQTHDMSIKNYEGVTCLHLAQASSSPYKLEIINYLLVAYNADINVQEGKCGYTVLHQAIKSKDEEVIQYLLRQPLLDLNTCCYNGSTALTIAKSLHLDNIARLLCQCGAIDSTYLDGKCDTSSESDEDTMDDMDDLTIVGQHQSLR